MRGVRTGATVPDLKHSNTVPGGVGGRSPVDLTLDFAGDCTFGSVNGDAGPGRFPSVYRRARDPIYPFRLVEPYFRRADFTAVNFECTLTDKTSTADKQWHFKGPAQYASIFPEAGIDAVTLANNHSHDYLQAGFDDTRAAFRKVHVPTFYRNTPYITTVKGVELVLIGDCTVVGENTTLIDGAPDRVLAQIKRYKRPGNVVVVFMHWGSELAARPFPWQVDLGHKFIDAGADAVVGCHPHVLQGIETYKGRTIAYSLGNFAFGGNSHARNPETVILSLHFRISPFWRRGGGGEVDRTTPLPATIVPCLTTSTSTLVNNYRPEPVDGPDARRVIDLIRLRDAVLP